LEIAPTAVEGIQFDNPKWWAAHGGEVIGQLAVQIPVSLVSPLAGASMGAAQASESSFREQRRRGKSEAFARRHSDMVGLATGYFERLGILKIIEKVGGKKLLSRLAGSITTESGTEAAQELVTIAIDRVHGQDPEALRGWFKRTVAAGALGAFGGGVARGAFEAGGALLSPEAVAPIEAEAVAPIESPPVQQPTIARDHPRNFAAEIVEQAKEDPAKLEAIQDFVEEPTSGNLGKLGVARAKSRMDEASRTRFAARLREILATTPRRAPPSLSRTPLEYGGVVEEGPVSPAATEPTGPLEYGGLDESIAGDLESEGFADTEFQFGENVEQPAAVDESAFIADLNRRKKVQGEYVDQYNEGLNELLGNFIGSDRAAYARFMKSMKKLERTGEGHEKVPYFGRMLDMASTQHPELLQGQEGSPEANLFANLKAGRRRHATEEEIIEQMGGVPETLPPLEGMPELTSPRHRNVEADMAALGKEALLSKVRVTHQEVIERSRSKGLARHSLEVAERVVRGDEDFQSLDEEVVHGMTDDLVRRKNEFEALQRRQDAGEDVQGELDQADEEMTTIYQALYFSGSEAGRRLRFQQFEEDRDYNPMQVVAKARNYLGDKLTPDMEKQFHKMGEKMTEAQKDRAEAVEKSYFERAEEGLKESNRVKGPPDSAEVESLHAKLRQLMEEGCHLA
jgi:hypothetical protein